MGLYATLFFLSFKEPEPGVLTGDDGAQGAEAVAQVAKRHIMWQDVKKRVLYNVMCVWHFFLLMSYVPAIVCMMVGSSDVQDIPIDTGPVVLSL